MSESTRARCRHRNRRADAAVAHAWEPLRERFVMLYRASGRTQADVARIGGLTSQAVVSKILSNRTNGPTLDVFVKAVAGLGVSLAEFFEPWRYSNAAAATIAVGGPTVEHLANAIAEVIAQRLQPLRDRRLDAA